MTSTPLASLPPDDPLTSDDIPTGVVLCDAYLPFSGFLSRPHSSLLYSVPYLAATLLSLFFLSCSYTLVWPALATLLMPPTHTALAAQCNSLPVPF